MAEISAKAQKRIEKSKLNATVTLITSILMGVLSFAERTVFNHFFIEDYLGLYSFFNNIISILCTIELGIPTAIAYALYSPLEYKEEDQIIAIMKFFKKVYLIMGTFILIGGIALLPFLPKLLVTEIPMHNVRIYFLLFLCSTVSTFYIAYRNILLSANQEQYIITLVTNLMWTILYIAEMLVAYFTRNFLYYSICIFSSNFIRNIILNIIARHKFPYLKKKIKTSISPQIKSHIVKNTKGLISTKLGQMLVSSTDSILISVMVSTAFLGKYSNYQMITSGLLSIATLLPSSIVASIGNAGVTESKRTLSKGFESVNLGSFFIYSILSIILLNIVNPIVSTFFGPDRILPFSSIALICINFYISSLREVLLTYKTSLGLYWEDRKRPIGEGIANLIISIALGKLWGFNGIILGTILTNICINLVIEPLVIIHNGFSSSAFGYYINTILQFLLTVFISAITYGITRIIPLSGILLILSSLAITIIITISMLFFIFRNNKIANQVLDTLKLAFKNRKKR